MEKTLRFLDESGNLISEILSFTYNSKRMGGAPSITATLYSFTQLDFSGNEYAIFNGSRYNLKSLPSSEKNNTDARYKYNITLTHEREKLDNIYFIDSISSQDADGRRVTNSTEFFFTGTIIDLVDRYNAILSKANLGYTIEIDQSIVDGDISKESRDISFDKKFWSEAIQEIYNAFEIPYYFVGKICHVGYNDNGAIEGIVKYGVDNALLSVRKENKNNKVVTRVTGEGSSENIPYYYPNLTPTGDNSIDPTGEIQASDIKSINWEVLSGITNLRDGATLTYRKASPIANQVNYMAIAYRPYGVPPGVSSWTSGEYYKSDVRSISDTAEVNVVSSDQNKPYSLSTRVYFYVEKDIPTTLTFKFGVGKYIAAGTTYQKEIKEFHLSTVTVYIGESMFDAYSFTDGEEPTTLTFTPNKTGLCEVQFYGNIYVDYSSNPAGGNLPSRSFVNLSWSPFVVRDVNLTDYVSIDDTERTFPIDDTGIVFNNPDSITDGSTLKITETKNWIPPQKCLMPSIYRGTLGEERFYNAKNEKYVTETNVQYTVEKPTDVTYETEFDENRYKEHIISFDYIKPTIKEMTNDGGERIDIFTEFAYDTHDNDEVDDKNIYKHPFFFAKLRKLPFNLFSQAIEGGTMAISMTTGPCAGCNFEIAVDNKSQKNLVQVDSDGNLKRVDGDVLCGREGQSVVSPQSSQNDTSKNEVWVALRKDDSAYGVVMPNVAQKVRPNALEDEFVITNILLPNEYILAAEKKLEEETLRYMSMNNADQFNFSIKFSRIFLQENDKFRNHLDENARVRLEYHGSQLDLYISEFTYKVVENEAIPEILVSITDTLAVQSTAMQHIVSEVKSEVITEATKVDIMPTLARVALRKDKDDSSPNSIAVKSISTTEDATIGGEANVGGDTNIGGAAKVEGTVEAKSGVTVGDYSTALGNTRGARISDVGDADFRSIRANYLEVFTLLYNQIQASSAYTVFDDTATIIEISQDENQLTLTFEGDEEYVQPFEVGDILHGYVNKLNNLEYSVAGECWLKVTETPTDSNALTNNQVVVVLYSDEQVPSGKNLTPTKNMVLAHRGNVDDNKKHRQHTFYISSSDGSLVQLMDVNSPMLLNIEDGYSNYGVVVGQLPKDLFDYVYKRFSFIRPNDPIVYAKYLAVQNLLQLDYLGRPIRTERYRGAWSKEVAMSDEPYTIALTTYDTVTHNGSLWMCQQSGTISEPSDTSTEWIKKVSKGGDASAVIYEIKPSANIVYVKGGSLSTNNLDVTIGRTDSNGYFDIADQAYLDSVGLLVQWAIDGGERHDLNISPDEPIDLEDESGELLAENGNALLLEGETIDISSIKDNITLYLVDTTTGNDMAERIIPVIKDGSNYEVRFTPSLISHPVDATTLATIGSGSYMTSVTLFSDGKEISLQQWGYSAVGNKDIAITPRYSVPNKSLLLKIDIEDGIAKSNQATNITLTLTPPSGSEGYPESIVGSMSIVYPQRGLVGPAGEAGPLLFPSGRLEFGVEYDVVYDVTDTSKVVAQPFFYNQTDEVYYVLQKKITAAENTEANLGNTDYWRPFTKIQYLFTEALMANWAKLAKFIFYAEFMFSQQGTNISGDEGLDWSSVAERMFVKDEDGNIIGWTGEFIPNTMIDALRGIISCGKFIEQFDYFTSGNIYRIDLNKAHNVYIPYKEANLVPMYYVSQFNSYPNRTDYTAVYDGRMGYYTVPQGDIGNSMQEIWWRYYKSVSPARFVTLPEFSEEMATAITEDLETGTIHETMWLEDGTHVCIMHELSDHAMNPSQNESGNTDFESPVIVFPDNSVLDISNYSATNSSGKYEMGGYSPSIESYFVWRGIRVSAVILAPGTMLKLRSSHVKYNGKNIRLWYVENSSDFDVTAMTLNVGVTNSNVEVRGTTKVDFHLDPIGWRDYGRTVIGSCMMNQTLRETSISEGTSACDKDLAYKNTIKTTLYNIYPHALYADENSAMTYTLWFNNVTVANDGSITMNDGGIVDCTVSNTALVNTLDNKAGVSYTGVKEI